MPIPGRAGAVAGSMYYSGGSDWSDNFHDSLPEHQDDHTAKESQEALPESPRLDSTIPMSDAEEHDAGQSDTGTLARSISKGSDRSKRSSDSDFGRHGKVDAHLQNYHASQWDDRAGSKRRVTIRMMSGLDAGKETFWNRCAALRQTAAKALDSPKFDVFIGSIIVLNAANIGMEQTFRGTGQHQALINTFEDIFLSIYVVELFLRFAAIGVGASFRDGWVRFDMFLVALGIVTQWMIKPIFGKLDEVGPIMVLRMARLLRLAKTVRLLIKFRELWMLVRGLLNSANTMVYTLLMLFVITYIFSCLLMELLYEHPLATGETRVEEFALVVEDNFATLPATMLTLLQFVSFDNIVLIYKPLAKYDPLLLLYFISLILVVGIVVMNLVTAVIVNSALEQTAQDKDLMKSIEEAKKKQVLKDLRKMFQRLDEDGSGELSRVEIQSVDPKDKETLKNLTSMDDPVEIFDALDVDGSGDIGIDEFCDGLWQVAISNAPIEIKRMEKQLEFVRAQMKEAQNERHVLHSSLDKILHELRRLGGGQVDERSSALSLGSEDDKLLMPRTMMPSDTDSKNMNADSTPSWARDMLQELHELREISVTMALATATDKLAAENRWLHHLDSAKAATPAVLHALEGVKCRPAFHSIPEKSASAKGSRIGTSLNHSGPPSPMLRSVSERRSDAELAEKFRSPLQVPLHPDMQRNDSAGEVLLEDPMPSVPTSSGGEKPVFLLQPDPRTKDFATATI